jgi:hypothetical protein
MRNEAGRIGYHADGFVYRGEADLVKCRLKAEGIDAMVHAADCMATIS